MAMALKAVCLQRRFGLELGKAKLLWSSLGQGWSTDFSGSNVKGGFL